SGMRGAALREPATRLGKQQAEHFGHIPSIPGIEPGCAGLIAASVPPRPRQNIAHFARAVFLLQNDLAAPNLTPNLTSGTGVMSAPSRTGGMKSRAAGGVHGPRYVLSTAPREPTADRLSLTPRRWLPGVRRRHRRQPARRGTGRSRPRPPRPPPPS